MMLAETVWSLKRIMGCGDAAVAGALRALVALDRVSFEREGELLQELDLAVPFPAGTAGHPVARSRRRAGCRAVVTFDRKAASRVPGKALLA